MSSAAFYDNPLAGLPRHGVTERPCAIDVLRHAAQAATLNFHHVVVEGKSEKLDDKHDILGQLAQTLGFPSSAGRNYDAFYDCLTDMPPGQLIVLDGLPASETAAIILDIFRDAANYFAEKDTRFVVLF